MKIKTPFFASENPVKFKGLTHMHTPGSGVWRNEYIHISGNINWYRLLERKTFLTYLESSTKAFTGSIVHNKKTGDNLSAYQQGNG